MRRLLGVLVVAVLFAASCGKDEPIAASSGPTTMKGTLDVDIRAASLDVSLEPVAGSDALSVTIQMTDGYGLLPSGTSLVGAGRVDQFDYIGEDSNTAPMLKLMRGPDGKPTGDTGKAEKITFEDFAKFVADYDVEMLGDADWPLSDAERSPVLAALAYVCDPEDIIPDEIPGIGLLDDAVMIELVFLELRHEIEAYEDFCRYRRSVGAGKRGSRAAAEAASSQLARRRTQLVSRMRRRRAADKRGARG